MMRHAVGMDHKHDDIAWIKKIFAARSRKILFRAHIPGNLGVNREFSLEIREMPPAEGTKKGAYEVGS
jgi:hypothetical protein